MRKVSSGFTFIYKKVYPAVWIGFLGAFLAIALTQGFASVTPLFLVAPAVMATLGFFLMKKLLWDLVDEVYDGWEYLLVKNRGQEIRIPLSEIVNINVLTMMNPPRITLRLRNPTQFGDEIAFSPLKQVTLSPFEKNDIAEELIARVDHAKLQVRH